MNVSSVFRHRLHERRGQRGSSLILVMSIMVIGMLSVVALMSYTTVSLRSASAYRTSTERLQAASDAVDVAVAEIREDRTEGSVGSTPVEVVYDSATAKCTAEAGSGAANPGGGFDDRTVRCTGSYSGKDLLRTRVQFVDLNGTEPGAVAQELERRVGS
ncbi:hypothetical protein [Candidatus Microthrix parvicella]|uniref:hypothetical protein n=1 Tax=Candidatus Neomicrothrix parvicella TaxID=41950 RepID=UPI00036404F0|nr:hypothetical protein [Candidatus Microthrix parvicella]